MPEQSDYRHGQGVWRLDKGNGVITGVDWRNQEVFVEWYNSKDREIIAFDILFGNWDWKMKQWVLTD